MTFAYRNRKPQPKPPVEGATTVFDPVLGVNVTTVPYQPPKNAGWNRHKPRLGTVVSAPDLAAIVNKLEARKKKPPKQTILNVRRSK